MKAEPHHQAVTRGYDLIGDIHGEAAALTRLLETLGYENGAGWYRHPERTAIFVGDLIDRGPQIAETLRIASRMVDAGAALAVMGNHEYNALGWHSTDSSGAPLRQHSEKHRRQHAATLAQFATNPTGWRYYLDWFKTLPLYLDLPELRVVHACWDTEAIAALDGDILRNPAVKPLLKGPEVRLPRGSYAIDKEGGKNRQARIRWWERPAGKSYRDTCFSHADTLPPTPVATEDHRLFRPYPAEAKPVFFGHYWISPHHAPAPLAPNVACIDYSAAAGGPLVAYRWQGERVLDRSRFCVCTPRKEV